VGQGTDRASIGKQAEALLARAAASAGDDAALCELAVELAACLFQLAEEYSSASDRARQARIARLLSDPEGQLFSILLTDRVAHDASGRHAVDQLDHLVERLGLPRYMLASERWLLSLGRTLGRVAPRTVGSLMLGRIRREVEGLVFSMRPSALASYLAERRRQGVEVNLNHLGEEVLGEADAERRVNQYIALLEQPEVRTVSIKLSAIYSQIDVWAWQRSLDVLSERLRRIYRAALAQRGDGERSKLVYLDMEAYRDLELSLELFTGLLDEPEFLELSAGVVLQAYVPDSAPLLRRLLAWQAARKSRGGARLRLRVVKGANLAAERVRSGLTGWPLPIYASKAEVDASYKRLLYMATEPAAAELIDLGIASHNVFDIALGLVLRSARGVERAVGFELLEGMANGMRQALRSLGAPVLVYAPAVEDGALNSAVAYLIRRLDENTAPENYLRHAFSLKVGDGEWQRQVASFRQAHAARVGLSELPLVPGDRFSAPLDLARSAPFSGEPDTDFAGAGNRAAVNAALDALQSAARWSFSSVIAADVDRTGEIVADGFDPSRPGVVPYQYSLAPRSLLEAAVTAAAHAREELDEVPLERRVEWVRQVAVGLRRRRAELIAGMVLDCGKRVVEADAEVSEAIDFAEYYLRSALEHESLCGLERKTQSGLERKAKGVVLVASPWNFPLAIPLSGILGALLAGNAVLFKPPLETPYVGEQLATLVWQAGVPQSVLQFLLCRDEEASLLIDHPKVDTVVLTGATSTARFFLDRRPGLDLAAETGGKNALIVSALADRELAIRDLLASAFGHAGQKCSAASLAILHREVYDDRHFMAQLADAAKSLRVGSAWAPDSFVTPLIRPAEGALLRGLTQLDKGESWLLEPRVDPDNPRLCSPGIKLGVAPGSFTHQTELFGPVLGVMRGKDFDHCLALANGTAYGLVGGLHSLDEREQQRYIDGARCGNLYINRKITGAIVGRQPFGGHKASNVGPGAKAGGPNYVLVFQHLADPPRLPVDDLEPPSFDLRESPLAELVEWVGARTNAHDRALVVRSLQSYGRWLERHFQKRHREHSVIGEDNEFRYQPCSSVAVFAAERARVVDLARACAAGFLSGVRLELSLTPELAAQLGDLQGLLRACAATARVEGAPELAERLSTAMYERVRWLGDASRKPPEVLLRAAAARGVFVADQRVVWHGRYELLRYHREQTISFDYHRYGHLGWKTLEPASAHEAREASARALASPELVADHRAVRPDESAA
jgi:RHH-type proline utilization regulon transcriptional repressor/proline dehydrogenase/delta 1-pyrroline-5-carboxylate dehydrogenase